MKPRDMLPIETIPLSRLKAHPRNYREHPADEIAHLTTSLEAVGEYRPLVVARDDTILVGHGVALALRALGRETVTVCRVDVDPMDPQAIKLLVGDNEIGRLAERNDDQLVALLAGLRAEGESLEMTGYDPAMLSALEMATRSRSAVGAIDETAEWVGMPDYENEAPVVQMRVRCVDDEARERFLTRFKLVVVQKQTTESWSAWWPPRPRDDLVAVRFTA